MIAADLPPTVARFPCSVEISIDAPGWQSEITAALGIYSQLSGTAFTEGGNGIHFVVKPSLGSRKGVESLGVWSPMTATISLTPAAALSHNARLRIALHEIGHAMWQDHSDEPDSVMSPLINPRFTVHTLSPNDAERIRAAGCKNYV